jgi:hypothetical protein
VAHAYSSMFSNLANCHIIISIIFWNLVTNQTLFEILTCSLMFHVEQSRIILQDKYVQFVVVELIPFRSLFLLANTICFLPEVI